MIPDNAHYVNRCVKLQNVEIDNYRVIVENDTVTYRDVYEPQAGQCLEQHYKFGESRQYLLDKSVGIEEITKENIQDMAIQIWDLRVNGRYVDDSNPLSNENYTYKIVKNWDDYKLEESEGDITETIVDEKGIPEKRSRKDEGEYGTTEKKDEPSFMDRAVKRGQVEEIKEDISDVETIQDAIEAVDKIKDKYSKK